jgi:hypothetical protein
MKTKLVTSLSALLALVAVPAFAQQSPEPQLVVASNDTNVARDDSSKADSVPVAWPKDAKRRLLLRNIEIQHIRPQDQRGINVFESPKNDMVPFTGFKLSWGAAFTQQFQSINHQTASTEKLVNDVNVNQLMEIGAGFNNATANLYLNAQLAPGIRVALTSYLSSRHHNETWVKDGYLLIDDSPVDVPALKSLMKYVTIKAGHFEVNYGDAHFRRSDNGNAMHNPFVGNLLMDAFTTEIGGEVYVRSGPWMVMGGVTGGEIRGNVTRPADRSLAFLGKVGYDNQLTDDLRVRLTGSMFQQAEAISNTLYAGDRAGSRYYFVLENTQATESAQFSSGLLNPAFRSKVKAFMVNPFVKYRGLEFFGVAERSEGRAANETETRVWDQYAAEVVYRFLENEDMFVGARYNTVKGDLVGMPNVSVERVQLGAGWFLTPSVLLKGEYVTQSYFDFPLTDIRSGGVFNGFVVEGVVSF